MLSLVYANYPGKPWACSNDCINITFQAVFLQIEILNNLLWEKAKIYSINKENVTGELMGISNLRILTNLRIHEKSNKRTHREIFKSLLT